MRRAALAAVATALLAGGCAADHDDARTDLRMHAELVSEQPASLDEEVVDGASIQTVLNHASLSDVAESTVRVEVESAAEYRYLGVRHTLSRVRVLDTLGGRDLTGRTLEVWQVGTASGPLEGLARPLRTGYEYVVYTEPFYLETGEPTDQWTVVAQGSWRLTGADAFRLDIAAADPAALPDRSIDAAALADVGADRAAALRTQVWDLELTVSLDGLAASSERAWGD